jgi:GT2 family glycosyltransferase
MENTDEKISVIIVNYNAGKVLVDCISSVINQVHEIIVVDNASIDNSLQAVENVFADYPKLHIIRNSDNLGFAKACNIGYHMCSGNSIFFLNPDCIVGPSSVALLNNCLHSHAKCGMVGGLILNEDGSEQGGGRRIIPTPWNSLVRAFGLSWLAQRYPKIIPNHYLHEQRLPDHPVQIPAISGSCMLARREAIVDVGTLDEGYFLHCEDVDWCKRFGLNGWKIVFVPDAKIMHHKGVCSRSRPIFVEWHKHKSMMRFYRKFLREQYPSVLVGLVATAVWLRFGVIAFYYGLRNLVNLLKPTRG